MTTTKALIEAANAAERALLGACLFSERACIEADPWVTADDFTGPNHAELWQAIVDGWNAGERIDPVTVNARCPTIAPEYLIGLMAETPTASNARRYAEQVADAALRRRLIHKASEITELAQRATSGHEAADRAKELLGGIEGSTGKPTPDVDIDTFIDGVPTAYDWLIPGWLEKQDRLLITAAEGVGKSTFLTQLAVQVAAGVHPWSLKRMQARNVTLIDLENGARLASRRLGDLRARTGADFDPQRLRIHVRPEGINLTKRSDRRWLIERCNANQAELLVIGPAYRMIAGAAAKGDTGGEDQVREATAALDDIRVRCNVTLVMETHAPHGGPLGRDLRPFGSSVWLRWPEFGIGIRQAGEDGRTYEVMHWRNPRDNRDWPTHLMKGAGPWPWTANMPPQYVAPNAA